MPHHVTEYRRGMDASSLALSIANHLKYTLAKDTSSVTPHDRYWGIALAIRDRLIERWIETQRTYYRRDVKRVYYLSMEYLVGRLLSNSMINLGLEGELRRAAEDLGCSLEDIFEIEPDPGLGNAGLGRLAACILDSMATLQIPGVGYGLRYEFGIFRQEIRDGYQKEEPDSWLKLGNPWEISRPERAVRVQFGGQVESFQDEHGRIHRKWANTQDLVAMPYDTPIPGYRNNTVNNLRLWSACATELFDLEYFNSGNYIRAVERRIQSENVTKVLYPNDNQLAGQELRLKQEYFLVSASIQDILRRYKTARKTLDGLPDKVAIQMNDTHPALAVPELMRLLVDLEHLEWDHAWDMTVAMLGYTNHTLMPEAMERWPADLFSRLLPRHLEIIVEINRRFLREVVRRWPGDGDRFHRMSLFEEGTDRTIRMAHLAVVGSHSVNGVSKLHSSLLQDRVMHDFSELFPGRFNSKTNGVTQRRWLLKCNPPLASLITARIREEWVTDLDRLKRLVPAADDAAFRKEWRDVKRQNKKRLAEAIFQSVGVKVDPDSLFDCQVKRIHEYKRQLLNVLHVIDLYRWFREGAESTPRTVIFAGKAAPGYVMAKHIIKLIHSVAARVNGDSSIGNRLKVVFLPDYGVSLAELIIPAADLSEQISTAGTEASGTGNMKLALNGAVTIGTYDGANIEILEEVGEENFFLFGLRADEIEAVRQTGYEPARVVESNPRLRAALDLMGGGFFSSDDPSRFKPIIDNLLGYDPFMIVKDFSSFVEAQDRVGKAYRDTEQWTRMSILNCAGMGRFSSDRTVREYARDIWGSTSVPINLEVVTS